MKSLILTKGMAATEPQVVTEVDYIGNAAVGLHYDPFGYATMTYDVLGNVVCDNASHNQHVMRDHSDKMKEIHRSQPEDSDIQKALDAIVKGGTPKALKKSEAPDMRTKQQKAEDAGEEPPPVVKKDEQKEDIRKEEARNGANPYLDSKKSISTALDDIIKGGVDLSKAEGERGGK